MSRSDSNASTRIMTTPPPARLLWNSRSRHEPQVWNLDAYGHHEQGPPPNPNRNLNRPSPCGFDFETTAWFMESLDVQLRDVRRDSAWRLLRVHRVSAVRMGFLFGCRSTALGLHCSLPFAVPESGRS